ncbi:MAG TPA: PDZ domain-containing protein [Acidimicrobiia bacterium]|nr:PDZ domain-containing protein [Acidimicrobiia bacterium]
MSRVLWLTVSACLAAACAAAPPDRSTLPEVAEVLGPSIACFFFVGPPLGVSVSEVLEDTGADGVLETGDVILALNGLETADSDQLRQALSEQSVGDEVVLELRRDGVEESAQLVLGPNPEDPERPFMGVTIQTAYEQLPAAEANQAIPGVPTARAIVLAGVLYGMEPSGSLWMNTGVAIGEETNWVATSESVFALGTDEVRVITDLLSGEVIDYPEVEEWVPARLIGAVEDDLLLTVTQEVPDDPELVAVGVSRFDPETGDVDWIEPISEGFGVPVTAWGSPESGYITLAGVDPEDTTLTGVDLLTSEGRTAGLEDLLTLGTPIGWLDEETAVFRTSTTSVSTVNAVTGEVNEVMLDAGLEGVPLYAVADGRSVLAVSGRSLVIDDLTTGGDVRVLAENCSIDQVGHAGWRP